MPAISYLDASAIVKLAIRETHTDALESHVVGREALFSSRLSETEVLRAAQRTNTPGVITRAREALGAVFLRDVDTDTLRRAGRVGPRDLRAGDAIHLATALAIGDPDLVFVTYDKRLADAAMAAGLRVVQPGINELAGPLPIAR